MKLGRVMINLDDIVAIKKLDESDVYGSVDQLPKQCLHAWEEAKNLKIPDDYKNINKIVMTGMGGSGLGSRVIEAVYAGEIKYPLIRVNDYDLPAWVDKKTLVICSSFSGTTEETVENAHQAQKRGTCWMAIGTGGELIKLAQQHQVPYYKITPTYNPSKQPRLAIGYSIIGQLAMVSKVGIINLTKKEVLSVIKITNKIRKECEIFVPTDQNPAKKMAQALFGKEVIFVASRHLLAAAYVFKNQMNENAKTFSAIFDIPELNHHLMEGLQFPQSNQHDLIFFFADSLLYPPRLQQRMKITKEIVKKNKISLVSWQATASEMLSQAFELIQFGGFVNFYLAMLNGVNPALIPWVDYFKIKLGQPLGQWK